MEQRVRGKGVQRVLHGWHPRVPNLLPLETPLLGEDKRHRTNPSELGGLPVLRPYDPCGRPRGRGGEEACVGRGQHQHFLSEARLLTMVLA